jgi:hypothetical protein
MKKFTKVSKDYIQGFQDALAEVIWDASVDAYYAWWSGIKSELKRDQNKNFHHADALRRFRDNVSMARGFTHYMKRVDRSRFENLLENDYQPNGKAVQKAAFEKYELYQKMVLAQEKADKERKKLEKKK